MTTPDYRSVLYVVGMLLVLLAAMMCVPAAVDVFTHDREWQHFILSAVICLFVGVLCALSGRQKEFIIGIREAFLITTVSWVTISLFAALPFYLRGGMGLTNAVFESVSGLTTTGSTVMVGLDGMPPGILLWRSLLQWIGGIGIVVMAI
ncbi:MAG: potassium transporter TrkG, partial [Rhodospirillales bacterium]